MEHSLGGELWGLQKECKMHLFLQEFVVKRAQPPRWPDLGVVFSSGWPQGLVYCVRFRSLIRREIKLSSSSLSSSLSEKDT